MEVLARYDGGELYISEFHNIQNFSLTNNTIPHYRNTPNHDQQVHHHQNLLFEYHPKLIPTRLPSPLEAKDRQHP